MKIQRYPSSLPLPPSRCGECRMSFGASGSGPVSRRGERKRRRGAAGRGRRVCNAVNIDGHRTIRGGRESKEVEEFPAICRPAGRT